MLQVSNETVLKSLKHHELNEIAYSQREEKYYKYNGEEWEPTDLSTGMNLSLYDVNKQIISQQAEISTEKRAEGIEYIKELTKTGKYFMLLCNELKYYTIFTFTKNWNCSMAEEVESILFDDNFIGTIKAIDKVDGAAEIWFTADDGETYVAYFFGYDGGVIECD